MASNFGGQGLVWDLIDNQAFIALNACTGIIHQIVLENYAAPGMLMLALPF
jgi:aconitase A